jgi:hypothetical protein
VSESCRGEPFSAYAKIVSIFERVPGSVSFGLVLVFFKSYFPLQYSIRLLGFFLSKNFPIKVSRESQNMPLNARRVMIFKGKYLLLP